MPELWWSARDGGDGSVSVVFFATKEEAEADQDNERAFSEKHDFSFGFAEPCFGKVPDKPNGTIDTDWMGD